MLHLTSKALVRRIPTLRGRWLATKAEDATSTTLTKADLSKIIAEQHDLSVAESARIMNTVLDTIVEAVAQKRSVRIASFGTFFSRTSQARAGRVPSTGKSIVIPQTERVKFKAYDSFKGIVNKD